MPGPAPVPGRQGGFTYLIVLFGIVLVGLALAGTATVWTTESRRMRERELLWVGEQYRQAIRRYYQEGPGGLRTYPRALEDLLEDHRWPKVRRHLRSMYPDPMTGQAEWGLVSTPDGQIVGVYSPSTARPVKRAGFSGDQLPFAEAETYSDWRFVYLPQLTAANTPIRDVRRTGFNPD